MSDVGKTEAQAPVTEAVVDDKQEAGKTTPETEQVEGEEGESEEVESADAEGAEGDAEGEQKEDEAEKLSKTQLRRRAQKAKEAELVAENKRLSERLAAAERNKPALDELGPKPDRSKYEDEAEYVSDLSAWKTEERILARQQKAHENTTANLRGDSVAAKVELFFERARALEDRYPGIEALVKSDALHISPAMRDALVESEKGPEVVHYLSANRSEMKRIFDLSKESPLAAARELGRIEATVSLPKTRTETQAPPPPSTVKGSAAVVTRKTTDASGDALSDDEWIKRENARVADMAAANRARAPARR